MRIDLTEKYEIKKSVFEETADAIKALGYNCWVSEDKDSFGPYDNMPIIHVQQTSGYGFTFDFAPEPYIDCFCYVCKECGAESFGKTFLPHYYTQTDCMPLM